MVFVVIQADINFLFEEKGERTHLLRLYLILGDFVQHFLFFVEHCQDELI